MEIEKEIYNKKFEDNHQKVVVNLIYTYGWITNLLRLKLNKHSITLQQYNILRILRGQYPNPATVNILKERMLDKMSDASRIVERLVQKDLVKRCVSNKDRRAVDILISQKGLDILQKLDNEVSLKDLLSKNMSDEEANTLSGLLDKMRG
ncbi:MAG: MarR family transcriptional regulator [Sphingobacteriales bacterium 17-39-43]|uniref:MarR family winged helix-turn-helix transcriptional regulator n=1 Tax=Daejeonella sp. TaxID=2805397 RepID=UPI000BC5C93B|nr:MarR family transcriptional regulator [Daejeonella sp.]OYX96763.1 MAG: MarR family transcriptional regulator [Sphingobacteriia bacterium 35-40-5]OYZ33215.1 MAG: MarR family transcriptional regulator [Sphingobacteriales bacterium 16-39-50]OYZ52802.1 MAG: MarR family transcriptional regulator [Sphingobacteriales bacterium 24-40-4]OZA26624.1 MAG: MarR family transcriptional regulator [Sphingobacteriales bacterium 17-39-43]OZA61679.1 MAG: MarR family transcriptional regulator [Sphingobacteriale